MFTDWILACRHHVTVFSLAAVLAAELALVNLEVRAQAIPRIVAIDVWYGIIASATVVFGLIRVIWGAKGYEYYLANHLFWTKMALFVAVGLPSIAPTLRYLAWGRGLKANSSFLPPDAEVARVTVYLCLEAGLFLCIPIAAAAIARGYGIWRACLPRDSRAPSSPACAPVASLQGRG
jgi:putative membrane protein